MKKKYSNKTLTKEVLDLTKQYIVDEDVECIYFLPYIKDNGEKVFEYHVVYDEYNGAKEQRFDILEESYKSRAEEFGGKLLTIFNYNDQYSEMAMTSAECRRAKDLLSSQILYDPTNRYYEIAHQFDRYKTVEPYPNTIDIDLKEKKNTK